MKLIETKLKGAFIIEPEIIEDKRGFFSRIWCKKEFQSLGLDPNLAQISIAFNKKKGTIRGMHFQLPPHEEVKIVQCTRGSIYDVIIDLRRSSKTFKEWFGVKITADDYKLIYIPKGFAHGYETLEDNTEVIYHMSEFFEPKYYSGVRWNDPVFDIRWSNVKDVIVSEKDSSYANFNESQS